MRRNRILLILLRLILMLGVVTIAIAAAKLVDAGANASRPMQVAMVRAGSRSLLQRSDRITITLPVEALDVQNVGAATVEVGYDPAMIQLVACQPNHDFTIALCNTTLDRDNDGTADAVRFNETSLDGLDTTGGNPLNLANITWTVEGGLAAGTTITLGLQVSTFTDVDGYPISIAVQSGRITITSGMENAIFLPLTAFKFDSTHRVFLPLVRKYSTGRDFRSLKERSTSNE